MAFTGQHHGTGVFPAYFVVLFMRGVTVGVVGTSSLLISRASGLPQNQLIAARGLGLILGPSICSRMVSKFVWSGESQTGTALLLLAKALCQLAIPRATNRPMALYLAFFALGLAMTMLDITKNDLVTRVFKERCSLPLNLYEVTYGLGALVAPMVSVSLGDNAWNLLVLVDMSLAVLVAGKRLGWGKPRDWKVKLRGLQNQINSLEDGNKDKSNLSRRVPRRVLHVGLAFLFMAQACETAMSAWAFTLASSNLGLPPEVAAMFPTAFYFAFTGTRFVTLLASIWLSPSTVMQFSTTLVLVGALWLRGLSAHAQSLAEVQVHMFLCCIALIGAGVCPLYATTISSIKQHGDLTTRELGWYQTCSALGNTMGLWMPGVICLPNAEAIWAIGIVLILNSHRREYPWWPKNKSMVINDKM